MKDEHFKMIQVYQFNMPQYLVKLGTKKKKKKIVIYTCNTTELLKIGTLKTQQYVVQ